MRFITDPAVVSALRTVILDGVADGDITHGDSAFGLVHFDMDDTVETFFDVVTVPAGHYIVSENSNTGESDAMRFTTRANADHHWQTMVEWCEENEPYVSTTDRDY